MRRVKQRAATALALGMVAFELFAQTGGNPRLTYRDSDPFLFCTKGQNPRINPAPCWTPIPPYTGAYILMPYCRPPNPYGKDWTDDDTQSLAEYLQVCPRGEQPGRWNGQGRPEQSPTDH